MKCNHFDELLIGKIFYELSDSAAQTNETTYHSMLYIETANLTLHTIIGKRSMHTHRLQLPFSFDFFPPSELRDQ